MNSATKASLRPYELPQHEYALWYDVGNVLGWEVQAVIFTALTDPNHRVAHDHLNVGEIATLKNLANQRRVLLQFA